MKLLEGPMRGMAVAYTPVGAARVEGRMFFYTSKLSQLEGCCGQAALRCSQTSEGGTAEHRLWILKGGRRAVDQAENK